MFKIFYEDMHVGDEERFGNTLVDRDEVIEFASKYDPQPFHLDDEIAKQSVFGKLCASGWHTSAMTMRLMVDMMMSRGVASMGSPGLTELSWPAPVFPGDRLYMINRVLDKRVSASRPKIGFVTFETMTYNQEDKPVLLMKGSLMIMRREAGA